MASSVLATRLRSAHLQPSSINFTRPICAATACLSSANSGSIGKPADNPPLSLLAPSQASRLAQDLEDGLRALLAAPRGPLSSRNRTGSQAAVRVIKIKENLEAHLRAELRASELRAGNEAMLLSGLLQSLMTSPVSVAKAPLVNCLISQWDHSIDITNFDLALAILQALYAVIPTSNWSMPKDLPPSEPAPRANLHLASGDDTTSVPAAHSSPFQKHIPATCDWSHPSIFQQFLQILFGDLLLSPDRLSLPCDNPANERSREETIRTVTDTRTLEIFDRVFDTFHTGAKKWAAASTENRSFDRLGGSASASLDFQSKKSTNDAAHTWACMIDACFLAHHVEGAELLFEIMLNAPNTRQAKEQVELGTIPPLTQATMRVMLAGLYRYRGPLARRKWFVTLPPCQMLLADRPVTYDDSLLLATHFFVDDLTRLGCLTHTNERAAKSWGAAESCQSISATVKMLHAYFTTSERVACPVDAMLGAEMWLRLTQTKMTDILSSDLVHILLECVPPLLAHLEQAGVALVARRNNTESLVTRVANRLINLVDYSLSAQRFADAASLITYTVQWVRTAVDPPPCESVVPLRLLDRVVPLEDDEELVPESERERLLTLLADLVVDTANQAVEALPRPLPNKGTQRDKRKTEQRGGRMDDSHQKADLSSLKAGKLLTMLIQSFGPLLSAWPTMLDGERRELWDQCIAGLFHMVAPCEAIDAKLSQRQKGKRAMHPALRLLDPHEWTHVLESLAWEESTREPDEGGVYSTSLGRGIALYEQMLSHRAKAEGWGETDPRVMIRARSFGAVDVLLNRCGEEGMFWVKRMDPRLAYLLELQPWSMVESETLPPLPPEYEFGIEALPSHENVLLASQHAICNALAFSREWERPYPPLQEIDEDLGWSVAQALSLPTHQHDKLGTALEQVEAKVLENAAVGTYPPPDTCASMIHVAGLLGQKDRLHKMYRLAVHILRELPSSAAAQGWEHIEDAMVVACSVSGEMDEAHAHRHALLRAGLCPSGMAYGALLASLDPAQEDSAQWMFQLGSEFERLGGPNASSFFFHQMLRGLILGSKFMRDDLGERLNFCKAIVSSPGLLDWMHVAGVPLDALSYGYVARSLVAPEGSRLDASHSCEPGRVYSPTVETESTGPQEAHEKREEQERAGTVLDLQPILDHIAALVSSAPSGKAPSSKATFTPMFNVLLAHAVRAGRRCGVEKVVRVMQEQGVPYDTFTFRYLLDAYGHIKVCVCPSAPPLIMEEPYVPHVRSFDNPLPLPMVPFPAWRGVSKLRARAEFNSSFDVKPTLADACALSLSFPPASQSGRENSLACWIK